MIVSTQIVYHTFHRFYIEFGGEAIGIVLSKGVCGLVSRASRICLYFRWKIRKIRRACPSKKVWDCRSSKIDSDAIWEVKSHLELYSLHFC